MLALPHVASAQDQVAEQGATEGAQDQAAPAGEIIVTGSRIARARAGYDFSGLTLELFVNNVLNSSAELGRSANRGGCSLDTTTGYQDPACPIFVTYNPFTNITPQRPREFGLRMTRRF